jgi:hypothetical protein
MRSYIIPTGGIGGAYIVETSTKDYVLPVSTYISETAVTPPAVFILMPQIVT